MGVRSVTGASLMLGLVMLTVQCARVEKETAPSARASEGARAFLAYCGVCHDETGGGNGPEAERLRERDIQVAHLNDPDRIEALGPEGVRKVVVRGGGHTGRSDAMPAWGRRLRSTLVDSIVSYVMTLPYQSGGEPPEAVQAYLEDPPGVMNGARRLYVFRCSGCHGPQGRGDGYNADTLRILHNILPRDLTDTRHFQRISDRDIYDVIALGGGHVGMSAFMPAWSHEMKPEEIESLVGYVRMLSGTASGP